MQRNLRRVQEQAIRDVVAMQKDIGLKLATDGEYNRGAHSRRGRRSTLKSHPDSPLPDD